MILLTLSLRLFLILYYYFNVFISGVERKGSYSQQPYLANYSFSLNTNLYIESMVYNPQSNKIYFGTTNFEQSIYGGQIYSTTFSQENSVITDDDLTLVFSGNRYEN